MRPDQLDAFVSVTEPAISPDGSRILVTVTRMNLDADRYDRSLHLWDGDGLRSFTAGPGDSSAVWSPDGDRIAFLREVDGIRQVAVIPAGGGEATVVSEAPRGIRSVEWAGDRLVVHWVEWAAGMDPDDRSRAPKRITSMPYRFDTLGWIHEVAHRVTVLDAAGSDPVHLTDPIGRFASPVVDGDRVVFLADRTGRLLDTSAKAVHAVPLAGGDVDQIAPEGAWTLLVATPDGVVAVGAPSVEDWPSNSVPYRLGADGPEPIVPDLDRSTLLVFGAPVRPQATDVGLLSLLEDSGRVGLARLAGRSVEPLVTGDRYVTGLSATSDGTRVAFTASSATDPGELWLWDGGTERRLTDLNATLDFEPIAGDRISVEGEGGPVDAWVFLPPGDGPVPLLLNIHGGPSAQYGEIFFDEFQVYVAAGYGVVACNPRGSSGRGEAWMRAVTGDGWGTVDVSDVDEVVKAALDRFPRLDRTRMGIMGGSYGGFLTAWMTGRQDRWSSSVVERALLSFPSFWGTSDIGTWFSPRYASGATMRDDTGTLWEKSPLKRAHDITAPTLILHSENDFRCPIEQAEQLFVSLLEAGTPTEFLRFPDESHELSRSGKPKHRKERFEAILDWHGRWLKP